MHRNKSENKSMIIAALFYVFFLSNQMVNLIWKQTIIAIYNIGVVICISIDDRIYMCILFIDSPWVGWAHRPKIKMIHFQMVYKPPIFNFRNRLRQAKKNKQEKNWKSFSTDKMVNIIIWGVDQQPNFWLHLLHGGISYQIC